ncbi:MAG: hypothetical protein GWP61_04805 [Chloroflexi bacterium]|jgi:hypothetical protein|nr:hypothetical protein [Chloroflexota bacterium]
MMENETPRTRSLLRQAERNADSGKIVAAEMLYRQIIEEAPQSTAAWLGLAQVMQDTRDKQAAYERVLELDEGNQVAMEGLAALSGGSDAADNPAVAGESKSAEIRLEGQEAAVLDDLPTTAEISNSGGQADRIVTSTGALAGAATVEDEAHEHTHGHAVAYDPDAELFCYRHPNRSTSLRCYKCNKAICSECTVKTPVGYLCPDCHREAEDAFFNSKATDYLLAALIALPLSLIAGWLVVRFSGGIFIILLFVFAGGAVGGFIARMSKRVIGNRRGRYIPYLVAACIIIGVLVFAWPWLLFFIAGNAGVLLKLAGIGVYMFTAASSAFYWAR